MKRSILTSLFAALFLLGLAPQAQASTIARRIRVQGENAMQEFSQADVINPLRKTIVTGEDGLPTTILDIPNYEALEQKIAERRELLKNDQPKVLQKWMQQSAVRRTWQTRPRIARDQDRYEMTQEEQELALKKALEIKALRELAHKKAKEDTKQKQEKAEQELCQVVGC